MPSPFVLNDIPLHGHPAFVYSSICHWTFQLFPPLGTVNTDAMNIGVHPSTGVSAFRDSFGYFPRSGIAGSYSNSVFDFLRKHHIVFHSTCTIWHSYQQCISVAVSLHLCQYFFFIPLIIAILMGMKWYLFVVFIFISWVTNSVEHLFMCSSAICISFLDNC